MAQTQIENLQAQLEAANERGNQYIEFIIKLYSLIEQAEDAEDTLIEILDTIEENRKIIPGLNVAIIEYSREKVRDAYEASEGDASDDDLSPTPFNGNLFGGA